LASGFIIKPDGIIVTNFHVVANAKEMAVKFPSGEVYRNVYLLSTDSIDDLAFLNIEAVDCIVLQCEGIEGGIFAEDLRRSCDAAKTEDRTPPERTLGTGQITRRATRDKDRSWHWEAFLNMFPEGIRVAEKLSH
jgi:hypothetical protein